MQAHYSHLEESDIVEKLKEGDHELFSRILQDYRLRMYRHALRITRNTEDAEDAVQEAMLNAYRKFSSFRSSCKLSTWLTRIVINSSLQILRKKKRGIQLSVSGDEAPSMEHLQDPTADVLCLLLANEETHLFRSALAKLKEPLREALELTIREDVSLAQVASFLGVSVPAAKSRAYRARLALRSSVLRAQRRTYLDSASEKSS